MRFELIDRVLDHQEDKLVAVKNVSLSEEYLADHFPGFAVLPGVMMLETMVQAARLLLAGPPLGRTGQDRSCHGARHHDQARASCSTPLIMTEARNVRYGQMVRPGQSLQVEVAIRSRDENGYELTGVGKVGDQVAVQGRFRMAPLDLSV